MNHELRIFNQIRNTFAHEINPLLDGKITNLIKKYKFSPKNVTSKEDDPVGKSAKEGMIAGMITGILTRHFWLIFFGTLIPHLKKNDFS
jgi:hypothetical protein